MTARTNPKEDISSPSQRKLKEYKKYQRLKNQVDYNNTTLQIKTKCNDDHLPNDHKKQFVNELGDGRVNTETLNDESDTNTNNDLKDF